MLLIEALRYSDQPHMAFVGAGGKTTALFKMARELVNARHGEKSDISVLVTTTTHLGTWQAKMADHLVWIKTKADLSHLEQDLPPGIVLLAGEQSNDRLCGMSSEMLEQVCLFADNHHMPLLIEADGAQTKPLKAPEQHEPAIPGFTQAVVVVAGLTGLGKPLREKWVHRPEIFAELSGLHINDTITAQSMVDVLCHKVGGLKNIPPDAYRSVLLNQADTTELQSYGNEIAQQLVPSYNAAIITSFHHAEKAREEFINIGTSSTLVVHAVIEQVAGIVLAAGGSNRFGEPKQLLPWQDQPLVRHVVSAALNAGLAPVGVVVGAAASEVKKAIIDLPVRIVNNEIWSEGLSTSIKAGMDCLTEPVGGAIFLQSDQPQVSPQLICKLVEAHQRSLSPIVAPQVNQQRGTPVLFDASIFPALRSLEGDRGGRDLLDKYSVEWVDWNDPEILVDIDSPDDYQRFLELHPNKERNP